jgi:hypothetical protein
MRTTCCCVTSLLTLIAGALQAQDLSGTWQGTLGTGPQALRTVLRIAKADSGRLNVVFPSIDQGGFDRPIKPDTATLNGSAFRLSFLQLRATYDGIISANGGSIKGTWTQGGPPRSHPGDLRGPARSAGDRDRLAGARQGGLRGSRQGHAPDQCVRARYPVSARR